MRTERQDNSVVASSRTYGVAVNKLKALWLKNFGSEMGDLPGFPTERYEGAINIFDEKLKRLLLNESKNNEKIEELTSQLKEIKTSVSPSFGRYNIDDIPPNIFFYSIYDAIGELLDPGELKDVELSIFLRIVIRKSVEKMKWKQRINVGENSHFPRMFQYIIEFESWQDSGGFKVMNKSGRGRVPLQPDGPHNLKIRIIFDYIQ